MKSVERVKAAINFSFPDKIPVWKIGGGDMFDMMMIPPQNWNPGHDESEKGLFPHAAMDIFIAHGLWEWEKPEWVLKNPMYEGNNWMKFKREEIDTWGCIWNRTNELASMGHPGRPSLPNWKNLDKYLEKYTVDPINKSQYSPFFLESAQTTFKKKYKICILGHLGPIGTAANMRGFTNFLLDHKKNPNELKRLLTHITEWLIKTMDGWIKYGANPDGFELIEDLGTQHGPFFSPKIFQKFYEPIFRTIYKAAHDRGCEIHQHCCGKIDPIIPSLIDWGLDALELDSPRMTGYPALRQFRGKIMYWGCVNIQSIYVKNSPEDCEKEVWHMIRNLGTPEGGFGAFFYPEPKVIKAPIENIQAFKKGIKKYGVYKKVPEHWWDYPILDGWENGKVPPLPPIDL
ncbi:MAG: uroporphyrinogen decarboxylase family protein [Candidatus Hermodarchaeota archaeon]